jgi:hypothetical protein
MMTGLPLHDRWGLTATRGLAARWFDPGARAQERLSFWFVTYVHVVGSWH